MAREHGQRERHRHARRPSSTRCACGERFALVTHEHPDGDALGSLLAMQQRADRARQGLRRFHRGRRVPARLRVRLDGPRRESAPSSRRRRRAHASSWTAATSSATRPRRSARGATILNLDHHHDNTRFGTVNHVVEDASCTAEIVWDLLPGLGVELTPGIAQALYVGLVTDTGRFSYENTAPRAHLMAADLVAAGVDVAAVYRHVYEGWPDVQAASSPARSAPPSATPAARWRWPSSAREDFRETGAEDGYTEGIVDRLRAVKGTKVAGARARAQRRQRALEGLAALQRRRGRRLDDRPRRGWRRPQGAAGFTTEMSGQSSRRSCRIRSRAQL